MNVIKILFVLFIINFLFVRHKPIFTKYKLHVSYVNVNKKKLPVPCVILASLATSTTFLNSSSSTPSQTKIPNKNFNVNTNNAIRWGSATTHGIPLIEYKQKKYSYPLQYMGLSIGGATTAATIFTPPPTTIISRIYCVYETFHCSIFIFCYRTCH